MLGFDELRTGSRRTALALGGLACALAGCGGSDSDKESTGGGMLQGSGSPATGSGSPGTSNSGSTEELGDCGVDGATWQLLSPTPGEDVPSIGLAGGSIVYGLSSGLYRVPAGASGATPEKIADGSSVAYFPDGDRVGIIDLMGDGTQRLTWVPATGGASTSVTLPTAAGRYWGYDAARNSFYAVTSFRPFSYLRYDVGSGQTEQFTTELEDGRGLVSYSPSYVVVSASAGPDSPNTLYRIEKGTTTAVKLEPGVDQFGTEAVDDENIYLNLGSDSGLPTGIYRTPMDGSAPAVRIDEFGGFTQQASVHVTDQGTFGQKFGGSNFQVIAVGGPTAASPLVDFACGSSADLAVDADNFYLVLSPRNDHWLLTVPRR